jgi:hypothetical protein
MKFYNTSLFVFLFFTIGSLTRTYGEDIKIITKLKSANVFKCEFLEADISIKTSSNISILKISADKGSIQNKLQGKNQYQLRYKDSLPYTPELIARTITVTVLYKIKERVLQKSVYITYNHIEPFKDVRTDTLVIYRNCENGFGIWFPDTLSDEQKINFYTIKSTGVNFYHKKYNELLLEANSTNNTFEIEIYRDSILISKKIGVVLEYPHTVWIYYVDNDFSKNRVFERSKTIQHRIGPGDYFTQYYPYDSRFYLVEYKLTIKRNGVILSEETYCPNALIQGSKTINLSNLQSGDQLIFKCVDGIRKNYQNKYFVAENPEDLILTVH